MIARQLTYFSAREKDEGRRCDLEAGMAKLLGARVAWANADNALQIHGGNGFALEYAISRVLCDARILNIFEGAAEIQAQVIAICRLWYLKMPVRFAGRRFCVIRSTFRFCQLVAARIRFDELTGSAARGGIVPSSSLRFRGPEFMAVVCCAADLCVPSCAAFY
jgi:hypothetical protein